MSDLSENRVSENHRRYAMSFERNQDAVYSVCERFFECLVSEYPHLESAFEMVDMEDILETHIEDLCDCLSLALGLD